MFNGSTVMAFLRITITAIAGIVVAKMILVPLNIPGVSKVVATA